MQLKIIPGRLLHERILAARYHRRMMRVVLYTRPGCHLCEVAKEVLLSERERSAFAFEEVSIEGDDALEHEYGIRVPVVEIDGLEVFEYEVDAGELVALVRAGNPTS